MEQIIKINTNKNNEHIVSARELHKSLKVTTRFNTWVKQNFEMFELGTDYIGRKSVTPYNKAYPDKLQEIQDYELSISMAKELAMMTHSANGKQIRQYFIEVEKQWNSPELMLSRSLQYANSKLIGYESQIAEMKPKVELHDVFIEKGQAIGIREASKELNVKQNGLIDNLMNNGYVYRTKGRHGKLQPIKKYVPKYFVLKSASEHGIEFTPQMLITPYGREFFYKKFYTPDQMEMTL